MCSHSNRPSTHNIPFLNIKKENHPKLFHICIYGICSKGLKEFETAVVNEPSAFEPLKFYCTFRESNSRISLMPPISMGANALRYEFAPQGKNSFLEEQGPDVQN